MLQTIVAWMTRFTVAFELIAALIPVFRTGFWLVRLFDFPRPQLLMLMLIPVGLIALSLRLGDRPREPLVLAAILVIVSIWQVSHIVPYTSLWPKELPPAASNDGARFRLVVANLQIENTRHEEIEDVLRKLDADLLLVIEINQAWSDALPDLKASYTEHVEVIRDEGLGIALWSKLPLRHGEVKHLVSERRASIYAEVELPNGRPLQFVGVHPTPPGLQDSTSGGRRDSRVRDAELILVAKDVQSRPNSAWIVAGDFNDVAWSHTTSLFKRTSGLLDPRIGRQLLCTYHSEYPLLRYPIDQVFLSRGFEIESISRTFLPGSDHFAVVTDMSLGAAPGVEPRETSEDRQEAREIIQDGKEDAAERGVVSEGDSPRP